MLADVAREWLRDAEGELYPGSSLDAVLVFDTAANPGACVASCETPRLSGLSETSRQRVWDRIEWVLPEVEDQSPTGPEAVANEPWNSNFRYATMPRENDSFATVNAGAKVSLRFKDRHDWAYYQPVQFRFTRTGTKAAEAVLAANTLTTDYVAAGNPNWYVYWQQVANPFTFGPQAQKMVFSSAETNSSGAHGTYYGAPTGPEYTWKDNIKIYKKNERDIVFFIETIHHENGHRQSSQLPPYLGGFGAGLTWSRSSDRDGDLINDLWETNAVGIALGFTTTAGQIRLKDWSIVVP